MAEGRWTRSQPGQYRRVNRVGKQLAYVYRYGDSWHATVYVAGEPAREFKIRTPFRSMRAARSAAEGVYIEMTRDLLVRRQNKGD